MSCHLTFFLIKSINCVNEFKIVILVVGEVQLYHEDEAGEGRSVHRPQAAVVEVNFLEVDHGVLQEYLGRQRAQVVVTEQEGLKMLN